MPGQELLVQVSSIYGNETRTEHPQMVDVAVATESILDWRTSTTSVSQSSFYGRDSLRGFPHILVEAPDEPKDDDTNPQSTPIEPISEVPYVKPNIQRVLTPLPVDKRVSRKDYPSSLHLLHEETSVESIVEVSPKRSSTSDTEPYEIEERLVTKTQKFFKKRAPLVPRYDSEDSFEFGTKIEQEDPVVVISRELTATDSEGSFSENDKKSRKDNTVWDTQSRGSRKSHSIAPSGRHLGSGMVFIYMVIPPDGGFGWMIMFLSFFAQLIIDGLIFTIGVLLPFIAKDMKVEITSVLFVASVQIGCYFTSGAFAAALINRFGFRKVAIAGVLCTSSTILIASCSVNVVMLICFYSIIGGFTMSLIWASSQLIVGYYFERYRPMATGFSCSGGGAGIVLFTFLNAYLVPIIGWRNMFRTQAGFVLLILIAAIAFVEVPPTQVGMYHHYDMDTSSDEFYGNFYVHDYMRLSSQTTRSRSILSSYEPSTKKNGCARFCSCCTKCCPKQHRKEPPEDEQNLLIRPAPLERDDLFYTGPAEYGKPHNTENLEGREVHLMGSDKNTQQVNYGITKIHLDDDERSSVKSIFKNQRWDKTPPKKQRSCLHSKFMITLVKLFDYRLLKQFEFKILVASALLFPMGFNIPFIYSSSRTTIPIEYARFIGPLIGICNMIFRNICGFVAYKRRHWTTMICGFGLVFGGCSVFTSAFYGQDLIWFQFLYAITYAVATAVFSTMRGLIYVKYLGLSKLTNAFGITSLAMGLGAFIGTTIAGEMVGTHGNYTAAFSFAGSCLIVSGALKVLLPLLVKCRYRHNKDSE
ncbi:monocarboxylate transporter 9 isoform X2 [Drosophila eugracilis]|uniref:monocarboxylate transporter 9 isoform X2 n=1 Tax=Drosophila eugracilis TaxID=29029 RepID=UPI0007E7DE0E|nr:monocarboxylate transporter 9 isoform X2 [Drosophila eugracilis]